MTTTLSYHSRTKILFGEGIYQNLPSEIEKLVGKEKILIVTDQGVKMVGLLEKVENVLKAAGFNVESYSDVKPDPSSIQIDEVANLIRSRNVKCVVGLGGGSAMDVAKMATLVSDRKSVV